MAGRLAAALVCLFLVAPSSLAPGYGEPAAGGLGRGRATLPGDWEVVEDTSLDYDLTVEGNVTVRPTVTLRLDGGATLTAQGSGDARFRFRVMVGAAVELANGSRLFSDAYVSEPGSGLSLSGGSRLSARGTLDATVGRPVVQDSTVSVASSGAEDARLSLNCSSWGDFQRSMVAVTAGNGATGAQGMDGQPGGNASLFLGGVQLYMCNVTASAGNGGDAGAAPDDSARRGAGGAGGDVTARLDLSYISGCDISVRAGRGGAGPDGRSNSPAGARSGGPGGRGGGAIMEWRGGNLLLSGTTADVRAGDGGAGGDGGEAPPGAADGGNGADGGDGGNVTADVNGSGTFTLVDSMLALYGGSGGAAGRFGLSSGSGVDGASGEGGAGGAARSSFAVRDVLTGTGCSLGARGGPGGAGGTGPLAGRGGPGGFSGLGIAVLTQSVSAALSLDRSYLSSRGGAGGDGGRPFTTERMAGIPGKGGAGGGTELGLEAEGGITAELSGIMCEPGPGGGSTDPNQAGAAGPTAQDLSTDRGELSNCTVSETIGPVDGEDRWTLVNTAVSAREHFAIFGKGVAEEYWIKRVTVKDVGGAAIMDGSATVEVRRNATLLESRRSNSRGEVEFELLDALYTASGVQFRSYVLLAYDTLGRTSQQITVFWSPDIFIDLVLVNKQGAPLCSFSAPAEGNTTIVDASAYAGLNGTRLAFPLSGEARDNPRNDEPRIEAVQLRFGETAPWLDLEFSFQGNRAVWNYSWDVHGWALSMLPAYPLGIIPLTVHARSYNGYYWSDDTTRGGAIASANLTVRLLRLPGPPPQVEITSPARSSTGRTAAVEVPIENRVDFDARVAFTNGRQVVRWVWCFDDTAGFREDFTSNGSPAAAFAYPAGREGRTFFAVLKVYDNESARRVELLRAGVAPDEFGYDFDSQDGSVSVRIQITVKAPAADRPESPAPYYALAVILAGAALAAWFLRVRRRK